MHAVHQIPDPNELAEKKLSPTPLIHPSSRVLDSRFGDYTQVAEDCYCKEMVLGDYSYLAGSVQALWCDIGKFSSIASHCVINPGNHPPHRVTQHHCTYRCKQYGFDTSDDLTIFEKIIHADAIVYASPLYC